ncbi:CobW family GTP-binding protein [Chryseomicrobium sp. FSL W7-1435]|uniref:CobW family GTP-binding protein n=1 Tax=Chryseomicrobium sp. FSL W7-1435 TaxID=2921704 RepID=UPI00315AEC22
MKDVYLLSGFLGSGKTTLLVKWITQLKNQGLRPAVIMNELGALGFDSDAVEDDVPLRELLDGCICCSPAEKTEAQIQQIMYQEEFDVLLIETTGAAHPVASLDVILSPLFADHFSFKGIVTLVDGVRFLKRDTLPIQTKALYLEQIRHGHLVILNKIDLLDEEEKEEAHFTLHQLNQGARLVETVHATFDFSQVENLITTRKKHEPSRIGKELQLGTRLEKLRRPYPQYIVEEWVQSLPDTIYRIKGYIQLPSSTHPHLFQLAYGMTQWIPEDVKVKTQLVVIGENVEDTPTLEVFAMQSVLKKVYPERNRINKVVSLADLAQVIDEELLDQQSHPRTRKTIHQKQQFLLSKLQAVDCSNWEENCLTTFIEERVGILSTPSH